MQLMIQLKGKYADAKVFTDLVEETAVGQVQNMINNIITDKTQVRLMPDIHAGKGSTIGTTIKLPDKFEDWKVCPNVVGVDVGCSIMMYKLKEKDVDLKKLDKTVHSKVPSGNTVHQEAKNIKLTEELLEKLTISIPSKNIDRIHQSLGTLGGGNHFIELGVDKDGSYWLSVHSGSRNLGVQVASTHQKIAEEQMKSNQVDKNALIKKLKDEGRHSEIQSALDSIDSTKISKDDLTLAYLEGQLLKDYLNDMDIAQKFAHYSRKAMLDAIIEEMKFTVVDSFDSVHNFIEHDNFKSGTIRKGATSAKAGERLVIPLNMRDGSLICVGKGNSDWNESAPHGAGRLMSRSKAKEQLNFSRFQQQMVDVYSTSVVESTIDEAPDAYKPAQSIVENIKDSVEILSIVKPVYNFKAH